MIDEERLCIIKCMKSDGKINLFYYKYTKNNDKIER